MKKILFSILMLISILFIANIALSQVTFHDGDLPSASKKAEEDKKYIMIDFYTEWCGWCKELDKNVYTNKEVGKYLNAKCINIKIDADSEKGSKIAGLYSVSGYPTIVFTDSSGKEVGKIVGYKPPEGFLKTAKEYLGEIKDDGNTVEPKPESNNVIFFNGNFNRALEEAKSKNLPMMVDFYTDWCGWCKELDNNVYNQANVANYLNKACINLKINAEDNDGTSLSKKYKITGFPTIVFINSEGVEIGRIVGYLAADDFLKSAKDVLDKNSVKVITPPEKEIKGVDFLNAKFDDALQSAKDNEKVIMIDFYTDWCGWCKVLDQKVYTNENVGKYLNEKCINLKINAEKDEGVILAKKYTVSSYPTIIFLDGEGQELDRIAGFMPAENFLQKSKEIIEGGETFASLQNKITANPDDIESLYKLAEKYAGRNDATNSEKFLRKILEQDPKNEKGFTIKAEFELAKIETVNLLTKDDTIIEKLTQNKGENLDEYIKPMHSFIEKYKNTNDPKVGDTFHLIAILYSKLNNLPMAINYFERAYPLMKSNGAFLNDYSWCIHQDSINKINKAIEIGEEAVKLEPNNVSYLINLSNAYAGIDQYNKALELAKKALELEPNNGMLQARIKILEKITEQDGN